MANYASQVNSAGKAGCSVYHSFILTVASCSQRFHSVFTTKSCKMHKGRNTISEHLKLSYPEEICLYMKLFNQQIHKMNASIYKNPGRFVHSFYSSILCLLSNESTLSIVLNADNKLKTKQIKSYVSKCMKSYINQLNAILEGFSELLSSVEYELKHLHHFWCFTMSKNSFNEQILLSSLKLLLEKILHIIEKIFKKDKFLLHEYIQLFGAVGTVQIGLHDFFFFKQTIFFSSLIFLINIRSRCIEGKKIL